MLLEVIDKFPIAISEEKNKFDLKFKKKKQTNIWLQTFSFLMDESIKFLKYQVFEMIDLSYVDESLKGFTLYWIKK